MARIVGIGDESASSTGGICSWPTQEDENDVVVVHVNDSRSSTNYSTFSNCLRSCVRRFRRQKKKAVLLKLPSDYYNKFLFRALQVGFQVHCSYKDHMMLILRLEEDEPSTLPANASNQVDAGPCASLDANLQQTNDPGVEVLNVSEPIDQTRRRALTPDRNSAPCPKRSRGQNFSPSEKRFVLEKRLHHLLHEKKCKGLGRWFHFVSKSYLDEHGIEIEPGSWQGLMDSLQRQFKAICAYEEKVQSGTSAHSDSFWNLSVDDRSIARKNGNMNLPLTFDPEMFQLVETINQSKTSGRQAGALGESSSQAMTATISDPAGPSDGNRPSSCSHEFQVSTESPLPFNDILPDTQGSQQLEGEQLDLPVDPLLQRSTASTFDEDLLVTKMAPFVTKQIGDALQPFLSVLQKREDEEKHREKMLATQADQQLDVMRQELDVLRQELKLQEQQLQELQLQSIVANSMGNVDPYGAQDGAWNSCISDEAFAEW